MTKKTEINNWSDVINNMKLEVINYYLKDDTDHKQPFKFLGSCIDYESGETIVTFRKLRSDDDFSYALELEKFKNKFDEVKEYY